MQGRGEAEQRNKGWESSFCPSRTLHCRRLSLLPPLTGFTLLLCHSVSLTIALFGLIEEYETARRDISPLPPTTEKICQFIS